MGEKIIGYCKVRAYNGNTAKINGMYVSEDYHAPKVAASMLYKYVQRSYPNLTYRGKYAGQFKKKPVVNSVEKLPANRIVRWRHPKNNFRKANGGVTLYVSN